MPYSPNEPLQPTVELFISGVWTTVTSRARKVGSVRCKHGRSDGAIQGETARCWLTLGNDDGAFTEGHPLAYAGFGRSMKIRVALAGILPSAAARFTGEIVDIEGEYTSASTGVVHIEAAGALGAIIENNDSLRAAYYRTVLAANPVAYWAMDASVSTTSFAWSLEGSGPPMLPLDLLGSGSTITANDTLRGTGTVATFSTDMTANAVVPAFTDVGKWVAMMPAQISSTSVAIVVNTASTTDPSVDVSLKTTTNELIIRTSAAGGGFSFTGTAALDTAAAVSDWVLVTLVSEADSSGATDRVSANVRNSSGTLLGTVTMLVGTTTHALPVKVWPHALKSAAAGAGPFALFADASFALGTDEIPFARAMHGWEGEQAHTRFERLCLEEGKTAVIYGSSSAPMGSQRQAPLWDLLMDCERADQGLVFDCIDQFAPAYRCRSDMYAQDPAVAIVRKTVTKDLQPRWNNQTVANEWTLTRYGGNAVRVSDEAHIAQIGRRLKQSLTVNLELDTDLISHAEWRIAIGVTGGPRYTQGGLNMRNSEGAKLADSVLGLRPGDRMTAATVVLPRSHPPGGFDQSVVGWLEEFESHTWQLYPNMIPAAPHSQVGVFGVDADNSRADSDASTLAASYTATATSFSVATTAGHALWATGSGASFAFDIEVSGIRITVTAVSGSSSPQTFTVTRSVDGYDKALSSGAQVRLWDPSRYGL